MGIRVSQCLRQSGRVIPINLLTELIIIVIAWAPFALWIPSQNMASIDLLTMQK